MGTEVMTEVEQLPMFDNNFARKFFPFNLDYARINV